MKKLILIAVFDLGTCVFSSHGQGYVIFSSYVANNFVGALTSFTGAAFGPVTSGYTADLYYALGTVSDPVNNISGQSIVSPPTGLIDLGVFATYSAATPGYFDGPFVSIPNYSGGPITFEVVAYNGSDYANSSRRGRSGSFTMNSIALPGNLVPVLGDNGQAFPDFYVYVMPEPSTLTLAGVGSLMWLVTLHGNRYRRKIAQWKDRTAFLSHLKNSIP